MFIVVGLGNPGEKYANTRHNVGFMVADALESRIKNQELRIIKPKTFMNRSGEVVKQFKDRAGQLIVVHDDVDLPLGTIRVRKGGSSAGHKGVQSVIDALGSDDFVRIRLGIGRPPEGVETEDYVLQPFTSAEKAKLPRVIDRAVKLVLNCVKSGEVKENTITFNF